MVYWYLIYTTNDTSISDVGDVLDCSVYTAGHRSADAAFGRRIADWR